MQATRDHMVNLAGRSVEVRSVKKEFKKRIGAPRLAEGLDLLARVVEEGWPEFLPNVTIVEALSYVRNSSITMRTAIMHACRSAGPYEKTLVSSLTERQRRTFVEAAREYAKKNRRERRS